MDYIWKKVIKLRRKAGLTHPVIKQSLCVLQPWKWVYHRRKRHRTSPLLVINQSSNRVMQKGGRGHACLQLKQKENNKEVLQAYSYRQRLFMLLEQTQLVMLSLILEHFWFKLSDPLCSSKAISLADMSSGGRNLQANQKTRQSQFSSLEEEAGEQLTPQAWLELHWPIRVQSGTSLSH